MVLTSYKLDLFEIHQKLYVSEILQTEIIFLQELEEIH